VHQHPSGLSAALIGQVGFTLGSELEFISLAIELALPFYAEVRGRARVGVSQFEPGL
jgi:hypothetical protein